MYSIVASSCQSLRIQTNQRLSCRIGIETGFWQCSVTRVFSPMRHCSKQQVGIGVGIWQGEDVLHEPIAERGCRSSKEKWTRPVPSRQGMIERHPEGTGWLARDLPAPSLDSSARRRSSPLMPISFAATPQTATAGRSRSSCADMGRWSSASVAGCSGMCKTLKTRFKPLSSYLLGEHRQCGRAR